MPLLQQSVENNAGYGEQYKVSFVITQSLPEIKVKVDKDRLSQVLSNLLSNAAKFSPIEGKVELSVARHDGKIRISVIDHGTGIPENFRDKIFQKFSQADSSDSRQKGGTGLGLSITKAMVEKMDGIIGFESHKDVGAHFYFDLPEVKEN